MSTSSHSKIRLDRLLVERGWGPRKEAQRLIRRGFVSLMDETLLRTPEFKVAQDLCLRIDGQLCEALPQLLVFHKPLHMLSTKRDPWGRAGLDYVLPERFRDTFQPVGRLDAETTGLLLFSSDGALTQRLLHPRRAIERTYLAAVDHLPDGLAEQLRKGVETSLGIFCADLINTQDVLSESLTKALRTLGTLEQAQAEVCVSVQEGKHRMVRRLLHNAGASVLALHRISFGGISLGTLEEGAWRVVSQEELALLS